MKNKILTILIMIILFIVLVTLTGCSNKEEQTSDVNNVVEDEYIEGKFEVVKVEKEKFDTDYVITPTNLFETVNNEYFTMQPQGKNFAITIIDSERNKGLIKQEDKVKCNETYTVKNSNVMNIMRSVYCSEGQDLVYPLVFFLLNDGTVKGIDIEEGYKKGEFTAYNISELKNIVTIEQADVRSAEGSGYRAILAITENAEVYEIRRKS